MKLGTRKARGKELYADRLNQEGQIRLIIDNLLCLKQHRSQIPWNEVGISIIVISSTFGINIYES